MAAQFSQVFAERKTLRSKRFVMHYRVNGLPGARLGLVIPKKQAQAAVLRNAIKRQARELFRRECAFLPAADIVLRLAAPLGRGQSLALATERAARADWRCEIAGLLAQLNRRLAA